MAKFLIRRTSPNDPIVGVLPAGADAVLGTAYVISAKDPVSAPSATTTNPGGNTFSLAGNSSSNKGPTSTYPLPVYFTDRPVRQIAGLSIEEQALGFMTFTDGNGGTTGAGEIMTPFEAGKPAGLVEVLTCEAEDPDNLVTSGTGALTGSTTVGTKLAFTNGKFYIAQSGDFSEYVVQAQMTPTDGGTVRVSIAKLSAGVAI